MTGQAPSPPATRPGSLGSWLMVAILIFVYIVQIVDRMIIGLVADDLKAELAITDTQVALLYGAAFALFYTFLGFPVGWLVDRFPRRWIVFIGINFWSACAMLTGLAGSFPQILAARIGVGAGEATLSPSAYSLIADRFTREKAVKAVSIYSAGAPLGVVAAFMGGGYLLDHPSLLHAALPPLAGLAPWRALLVALGLIGVIASPLLFAFREPARSNPTREDATWRAFGRFVLERRGMLALMLCGFGLSVGFAYGIGAWTPSYLRREFGLDHTSVGLIVGVVTGVSGVIGHGGNGFVIEALYRRYPDASIRYYLACAVIGLPFMLLGFTTRNLAVFIACLFVINVVVTPTTGYAAGTLQLITPSSMRGKMGALFLFAVSAIGMGCGPLLVAFISDTVLHKSHLGTAMLIAGLALVGTSTALLALARRRFAAAVTSLPPA